MFSIWIGSKPPEKELRCLAENDARYGITLIASENWIGAKHFIQIDNLISEGMKDSRFNKFWNAFPDPRYRSDALRLWYLIKNPSEVYTDSDCIIHILPREIKRPLFPSIQSRIERLAASFGGEPDMDGIRNSSAQWLDVWAIVGAGDSKIFNDLLSLWASEYCRPGGISEALSHGPFEVDVLSDKCFTHYSYRTANWKPSPV